MLRGFASDGTTLSLRTRASAADPSRRSSVAEAALVLGARSSHFTRRRAVRPPPSPRGGRGGRPTPATGTSLRSTLECVVRGACGCGARADMPSAEASGAICVQGLDDSRSSAIRITYRISLRSSSIREPRYPSSGVVSATREINSWGGGTRRPDATVFGRLRSSTTPARARGRVRRMAWGVSRVEGSPTPGATGGPDATGGRG
jgi:hypothetical protein